MNFIPEASVLIPFLIGTIIITITPGPDMTFFLSRAINQHTMAGLAAYVGASCGILVHTTLVALGLAALIVASPTFFLGLKLFGAGYLAYLAFQAIRYGSSFTVNKEKKKTRSLFRNWLQGVGINLLNPKIILFFMTFLPQFVDAHDPNATGKLFFLGGVFVVSAIPILVPMIMAAGKFSNWLRNNPVTMRVLDYLFATVFGAFAIKILLTQKG